jgi:hypothetical protein
MSLMSYDQAHIYKAFPVTPQALTLLPLMVIVIGCFSKGWTNAVGYRLLLSRNYDSRQ